MINEQPSAVSTKEDDSPSCQHHWIIQDSEGPISTGLCQSCGQLKEFKNYLATSHWGDEKSKSEPRGDLIRRPSRSHIVLEDDDEF